MNIIEAVKSGRPYKRKHHQSYANPEYNYNISRQDLIAEDWEIEPEPEQKIELSWGDIQKAWIEVHKRQPNHGLIVRFLLDLKKELGFK